MVGGCDTFVIHGQTSGIWNVVLGLVCIVLYQSLGSLQLRQGEPHLQMRKLSALTAFLSCLLLSLFSGH